MMRKPIIIKPLFYLFFLLFLFFPTERGLKPVWGQNPTIGLNTNGGATPDLGRGVAGQFQPHVEMRADARLNDVCFVGPTFGWAIGDHGAIWATHDGGQTWIAQESSVDCSLNSVDFTDENNGIIVGGRSQSHTNGSVGVILRTQDGGRNWVRLDVPTLPLLTRVQWLDRQTAYAAGCSTPLYPTGLFKTVDGGTSWNPVAGRSTNGWSEFKLTVPESGAGIVNGFGIGQDGLLQGIRGQSGNVYQSAVSTGIRKARSLDTFATGNPDIPQSWLVGEGGLVLWNNGQSEHWQTLSRDLLPHSARLFDLNTVFARGNNVWIAGSPGTLIFRSEDAGRTWNSVTTGITTPIRKIRFVSPQVGFAVGDLGTLLKTQDGGESWTIQRRGGSRVAILGVFPRGKDIPFELFVQICAELGYLGAVEIPLQSAEDTPNEEEVGLSERLHEAVVRCGVSGLTESWGLNLDRSELNMPVERIVERLQRENDGLGLTRFRQNLVKMIRIWRPNVLVSFEPGETDSHVRRFLVSELQEAVRAAGNPQVFAEQFRELGLEPWTVDKFYLTLESGKVGEINMPTNELAIRIGQPVDELAFYARGLIGADQTNRSSSLALRPVLNQPVSSLGGNRGDLMSGLTLTPGDGARRLLLGSAADYVDQLRQQVIQRNNVLGMLDQIMTEKTETGDLRSNVNFASSSRQLIRHLNADAAAQILWEMGRKYRNNGDWESAEEAYRTLTELYPRHPLSVAGFTWLIQFYAGEETRGRVLRKNQLSSAGEYGTATYSIGQTDPQTGEFKTWESRSSADGRYLTDEQKMQMSRRDRVGQYVELLNQYWPDSLNEPKIRFALAALQREQGSLEEAKSFYLTQSLSVKDGKGSRGTVRSSRELWARRAGAEYWLLQPDKMQLALEDRNCPLPMMLVTSINQPPYLDGQFDETKDRGIWFSAPLFSLTPLQEGSEGSSNINGRREGMNGATQSVPLGSQIMLLCDRQCLYLALRCRKSPQFSYEPVDDAPRPRDPDLSKQDRVEILIDVDRNFGTYYKLTIDNRGWVGDECWGDTSWNPAWFVAREEDADYWMIEAAIPFESLTERTPKSGVVWGWGVRRILPGVGIECWNAENSQDLTEGVGYLLFE